MIKSSITLAFLIIISGCSSIEIAPARHNFGKTVEFEKENTVSVGDIMFGEFDYMSIDGAVLIDNLNVGYQAMTIKAPSGYTLIESRFDNQISYCSGTPIVYNVFGAAAFHACFFDRDNDGRFESAIPALNDNWGDKPIPPVRYKVTQINNSGNGFKYELLYNGISGSTLNIAYREFLDQMARPAFQQDLTYTLNKGAPTSIAFRGARITIYGADNSSVRYVVHSGVRK